MNLLVFVLLTIFSDTLQFNTIPTDTSLNVIAIDSVEKQRAGIVAPAMCVEQTPDSVFVQRFIQLCRKL